MIETLLADAGSAAKSGGRPRLLELQLCTPARRASSRVAGRPGWVTLVQASGGQV